MNVAQDIAYGDFDGGSGADSDALRRQLEIAVDHSQLPTTRRLPSIAVAETMREVYATAQTGDARLVRSEALGVLNLMAAELLKYDLSRTPPMAAAVLDDGSLIVEWILGDRRLGLSFNPEPKESGWFLVSSPEHGNMRAHGRFEGAELGFLIGWALAQTPKR